MPKLPNRPGRAKMSSASKSKAWKNTGSLFAQRGYTLNKQWDDQDSYRRDSDDRRDSNNYGKNSDDWKNYVDKYDMGGLQSGSGGGNLAGNGAAYGDDWSLYQDRFQWGLNQEGAPLTPDAARAAEIRNQQAQYKPGEGPARLYSDQHSAELNSPGSPITPRWEDGGMIPRYDDGTAKKTTDIVAGVGIPLIALGSAYGMGFRPGVFDLKGPNIKENSFIDKLMQSKDQFPKMPVASEVQELEGIGRGYGYNWDPNDPYLRHMKPILPENYRNYNPERLVQYPSYDDEPMLWDAADRSHAQIEPVRENTEASNRVAAEETERSRGVYEAYNPVRRFFSHAWRWGPAGRARNAMNAAALREQQVREAGERSLNEVTNQHRSHMGIIAQSIARNEELLQSMARQRQQAANYRSIGTTTDVSRELDAPRMAEEQPVVSQLLPSANVGNPANASADTAEQFPIVPQLNSQADRDQLLRQNIDPRFLQQSNLPGNANIEDLRRLVIQNPEAAQNLEQNIDDELFTDTSNLPPIVPQQVFHVPITQHGQQMADYYSRRPNTPMSNNLKGFHVPATELPPEHSLGSEIAMPLPGTNPSTIPNQVRHRMESFNPPSTLLPDELGLGAPTFSRTPFGSAGIRGNTPQGFGVFESGQPLMTKHDADTRFEAHNQQARDLKAGVGQSTFQSTVGPTSQQGDLTRGPKPKKKMASLISEQDQSALSDTPGDIQEKIQRKPYNTTVKPIGMSDEAWNLAKDPQFRLSHRHPKGSNRKIYKAGEKIFQSGRSEFEIDKMSRPDIEQLKALQNSNPEVKVTEETRTRYVNVGGGRGGSGKPVPQQYKVLKVYVDPHISQALHHVNHRDYNAKADGGYVQRYDDGGDDSGSSLKAGLIGGGAALGGIGLLAGGALGSGVRFGGGQMPYELQGGSVPENVSKGFYLKPGSLLGTTEQKLGDRFASARVGQTNLSNPELRAGRNLVNRVGIAQLGPQWYEDPSSNSVPDGIGIEIENVGAGPGAPPVGNNLRQSSYDPSMHRNEGLPVERRIPMPLNEFRQEWERVRHDPAQADSFVRTYRVAFEDGGEVERYAFGGYSKQANEQMDQARQQQMQQMQQQQMQGGDPNQMQQQMPQEDPNAGMAGAPPQDMGQQLQQEEQAQPVTLQSGVVDVTGMLAPQQQQQGQQPMGQPQTGDVQAMSNLPYYQNQYAKMAQHAADPKRTLYRANKGTKFQTA